MAEGNSSEILNPYTPLAFLSPDVASQLQISRLVFAATLGAFAWDFLSSLPSAYRLLFEHKITPATITYFFSRIMSLAFVVTSTVLETGMVGNCQALEIAVGVCFALAIPSTSLLFLFRIRAVFHDQKRVVMLFTFLWVSVLAGCIAVPFGINSKHIGPTRSCIPSVVKSFDSAGIIISAVNDTLVLFAISLKLLRYASYDGNTARNFWSGRGLPQLSKTVLQSGQLYYLITVGWNVVAMATILAPSTSAVRRKIFVIPSTAIENCMACKVYRDVKFGVIHENVTTTTWPPGGTSNSTSSFGLWRNANTKRKVPTNSAIAITTATSATVDAPLELGLVQTSPSRRSSSSYGRNGDSKVSNLPA